MYSARKLLIASFGDNIIDLLAEEWSETQSVVFGV